MVNPKSEVDNKKKCNIFGLGNPLPTRKQDFTKPVILMFQDIQEWTK